MSTTAEKNSVKGLDLLSDEILADIVEAEVAEGGALSSAGQTALEELERRTPRR